MRRRMTDDVTPAALIGRARGAAIHREGLDIRSATDRIGQCPGCYSLHSVPPEMDWECDCGEAVTIIDLRPQP